MTEDEIGQLGDKLMAVVGKMPGEHAMEQVRVAFGLMLVRTRSDPDAGLVAFASAATGVHRGLFNSEATVEVNVSLPDRVMVYSANGQIDGYDVARDADGRARATAASRH